MNEDERNEKNRIVEIVGAADGRPTPHDGRYVVAWSPHTMAGDLKLTSTDDITKARRFSVLEAMSEWRAISRVQATRPWDGKPNRPLTGITIQIRLANGEKDV
jgi:hypothetical protein